jgi:hypothetical protein
MNKKFVPTKKRGREGKGRGRRGERMQARGWTKAMIDGMEGEKNNEEVKMPRRHAPMSPLPPKAYHAPRNTGRGCATPLETEAAAFTPVPRSSEGR